MARLAGFAQPAHAGSAVLVLEGEPGIGKTTLWRACQDEAAARGRLVLSCSATRAEA